MAHALGPGCFVFEIQEPSDLTAVPIPQSALIDFRKRANPYGVFSAINNEVYDRRTLGSFDYSGRTADEVLAITKSSNPVIRSGAWGQEQLIVGPEQTPYFSCTRIKVAGETDLRSTGAIQIGVVTEGSGEIITDERRLSVNRGSEIFFPFAASRVRIRGDLSLLLSHPAGANIPTLRESL